MENNYLLSKAELGDALELDGPTAQAYPEKHLKLILVNENRQSAEDVDTYGEKRFDEEAKWGGLSEKDGEDDSGGLNGIARPALSIYFKSINKYPLLDEETERNLATKIKKREKECMQLMVRWSRLFKKEFLTLSSEKLSKRMRSTVKKSNEYSNLFDDIIALERERKQGARLLKKAAPASHRGEELQEALNKVEAAISKSIAKMPLGERVLTRSIRGIKNIPCAKKNEKKRRVVETELRKTLREISNAIQDIKTFKNQLVEANLRLVISIAKKYLHHVVALPDLIQEGNLGLMRAIDTYDFRRGHRLVTYATWWIRQAMIRAIDCQSRTVRTPVYVNEKLNQIVKASNRLLQEFNREPTLTEIAEETKIPLELIEKTMQCYKDSVPLDVLIDDKGDQVVNPSIPDEAVSLTDQAISADLSHIINNVVLSDLTQREQEIVKLRFGIGENADHTLEEIGTAFDLSRERIRQILEMALHKIRTPKQMVILKDFVNPN
jgi:RNA polymerase primary sigma factor